MSLSPTEVSEVDILTAVPRSFQSHSPRNIVAGSLVNMDAVTERYRKQHLEEEERKAKKLAAQSQA